MSFRRRTCHVLLEENMPCPSGEPAAARAAGNRARGALALSDPRQYGFKGRNEAWEQATRSGHRHRTRRGTCLPRTDTRHLLLSDPS